MSLRNRKVTLHDMSLRDGMHPKRHLISIDQMIAVSTALDAAGMPLIEVTHGDGLGGASINYGFPKHTDEEYLRAVVPKMKRTKVSALLLPGIGTVDHLRMAADCGVSTIRVATHCTEADVSQQHIGLSRKLGLDTVGFLMMAHMIEPDALVAQGKLMESYGANCIYCTDSAGYMLPADVTARIGALWVWGSRTRSPRSKRGRCGSTRRPRGSARGRATRRWRCSWRCSIAWGSITGSICTK
jgi:4-hydroxy-2-oxovalerate/4-hydroxy-2-oxohexanoate aldolase